MKKLILFVVCGASLCVSAQKLKKAEKVVVEELKQHVAFLASDELEGRRMGTPGERKAAEYIAASFKKSGLVPVKGTDFLQEFTITEGKKISSSTFLFVNGAELKLNEDYFPLVYSAQQSLEAFPSMQIMEAGVPWFIHLNEFLSEKKSANPHLDVNVAIREIANDVAKKGATALFLLADEAVEGVSFEPRGNAADPVAVPVIVITPKAARSVFKDKEASYEIKLKIQLEDKLRKGMNVVGMLNNNADKTVVIGAHFDHLGYGEDGNSMIREENPGIHNGADDNASGTAVLLALPELIKERKLTGANYIFAAFSGEELGLLGSKNMIQTLSLTADSVNFMVNMDMIGRLQSPENTVTVGGFGTASAWEKLLYEGKDKDLKIKVDSSGAGPSDHYSFYSNNIPVLFFFTGTHTDYHKPSDDADKLNYTGMFLIARRIVHILAAAEPEEKLAFLKTRDNQMRSSGTFKVTLGIMPDYSFSGEGVRIDGTSSGRPAEKAGLVKGDIILRIDDVEIRTMEDYMKVLGMYSKGRESVLTYLRKGETLKTTITW